MEILSILLVLLMAATTAVLLTGIAGFIMGGAFNQKYGNSLMRARVGLQFLAVIIVGLLFMLQG